MLCFGVSKVDGGVVGLVVAEDLIDLPSQAGHQLMVHELHHAIQHYLVKVGLLSWLVPLTMLCTCSSVSLASKVINCPDGCTLALIHSLFTRLLLLTLNYLSKRQL